MKIKKQDLDPIATKKRELIEQLYHLIHENADEKKAFYDVVINEDKPQKSTIIANRPGAELFASELLLRIEYNFDDWDDIRDSFEYIEAGKKSKRKAKIRFSKLEVIEFEAYKNTRQHDAANAFNNSFSNIFWWITTFVVGLLTLFGGISVLTFFINR
ncbi:MAG: hypothetical protein AB8B56_14520 [Crocinitomicaceae bacterium]